MRLRPNEGVRNFAIPAATWEGACDIAAGIVTIHFEIKAIGGRTKNDTSCFYRISEGGLQVSQWAIFCRSQLT